MEISFDIKSLHGRFFGEYVGLMKRILKFRYAFKKNVTYDEKKRNINLQANEIDFKKLTNYRKSGITFEDEYFQMYQLRDILINKHNEFAFEVQGSETSELAIKLAIKICLEAGVDVKAMYYRVYKDDEDCKDYENQDNPWEHEDILRLTMNGLLHDKRFFPMYVNDETREEAMEEDLQVVLYDEQDVNRLYDYVYSIGELATIHAYKVVPDVLAMLIHAGADFMVRDSDDIKGVHAFIRTFQEDFDVDPDDKKNILNGFKQAYLDKGNQLTTEERKGVKGLFEACVNPESEYYDTISNGDRELIQTALNEINQKEQTMEK